MWSKENLQNIRTFYHGTTVVELESLKTGINLNKCDDYTDFGKGFYLTSKYEQAYRRAIKKAETLNKSLESLGIGIVKGAVVQYNIDISKLLNEVNLNQLFIFEESSLRWAKFVYRNRFRGQLTTGDHNKDGRYYVTYGPVADGNIREAMIKKIHNEVDFKGFCHMIKSRNDFEDDDQLAIHNTDLAKRFLMMEGVDILEHSSSDRVYRTS